MKTYPMITRNKIYWLGAVLVAALLTTNTVKAQTPNDCASAYSAALNKCAGASALTVGDLTNGNTNGQSGAGLLIGLLVAPLIANQQRQCEAAAFTAYMSCMSSAQNYLRNPPDGIVAQIPIAGGGYLGLYLQGVDMMGFYSNSALPTMGMSYYSGNYGGFYSYMGE